MIESGQSLNENVSPFVTKLVATSNEKIESLIQIKIKMAVKVTSNKLADLVFWYGMQILELMECWELFHVQSIWCDEVGLPF